MSNGDFKKIVFVIFEGASDETALGTSLSTYFAPKEVRFKILKGDVTSDSKNNSSNIVSKIADIIEDYLLGDRFLEIKDFDKIIHIVDADGVYIPNDKIKYDGNKTKFYYEPDAIYSDRTADVINRNSRKRACLNKLYKTKKIKGIPYGIYYMSSCLEHVICNKLNLTDSDKAKEAKDFASRYGKNKQDFKTFICQSSFSVSRTYHDTWLFIQENLNSLNRYTNLGCSLK